MINKLSVPCPHIRGGKALLGEAPAEKTQAKPNDLWDSCLLETGAERRTPRVFKASCSEESWLCVIVTPHCLLGMSLSHSAGLQVLVTMSNISDLG
jgi:hypothetical protein